MSSFYPNLNPNSHPNFNEESWIIHIQRALDEDLEEEPENIPVSIFNVPKSLMLIHPESYTPQQLALGLYDHSRTELQEMERYKISAAKRFQENLKPEKFHDLVNYLTKFEPLIRACYHKYINFNGETIAWIMAVDSCFLLEFLNIFSAKEGKVLSRISSRMLHLVEKKSAHNAIIVKDLIMLENQIPLFFLRKVLEYRFQSLDEAENKLFAMVIGFCKEILPFKMIQEFPSVHQVMDCAHLLDVLYHLIVPKKFEVTIVSEAEEQDDLLQIYEGNKIWNVILESNRALVSLVKRIFISEPFQFVLSLPGKVISNLPPLIMLRQFEYLCFSQQKEKNDQGIDGNNTNNRPPLIEEIEIPSVTELVNTGVKFSKTNSDVFSIKFDVKTATIYLPTISLDCKAEVAMRNLVAYEACSASGPLVFTRYTELMNGIIDDEKDVKILREVGIICNHLKSDQDVANLWNSMSKSIRLTKVPFLDEVIEDVNTYYNGRWRVRIGKFMSRYVFSLWESLTLTAVVLLLVFMGMQVFFSMFNYASQRRRMN